MKNAFYSTAYSNEKTYAVIHRHWFNIARQYIPLIFFVFFITVIVGVVSNIAVDSGLEDALPVFYFVVSLLYLLTWLYAFFIWVDYYLDIWIITSARVLNVEQKGFFSRTISELDYLHVQDVTSDVEGLAHTLFNYGDVNVQTAGTHGRFTFRNVPQPEKIKTLVMHLHRQALSTRVHPTHLAQEQEKDIDEAEGL